MCWESSRVGDGHQVFFAISVKARLRVEDPTIERPCLTMGRRQYSRNGCPLLLCDAILILAAAGDHMSVLLDRFSRRGC